MLCLYMLGILLSLLSEVSSRTRFIYDYNGDGLVQSDIWNTDWALTRIHQPKCIDIPANLSLCQGIGYGQMRLPNLLDHDTLREVVSQSGSWVPLLNRRCHPDTQLFLCSLFSPVCLEKEIWPCRSLCQSVKNSCLNIMEHYGYPWPDMLNCERFPLDNDLCIQQQNHMKDDNICRPCKQPDTFEGLIDNYCQAEFVIRAKITQIKIETGKKVLVLRKKKKFYKKTNMTRKDRSRLKSVHIDDGAACECQAINMNTKGKGKYVIMGRKVGSIYTVTCVKPWIRKNKDFKRAIKAMKKDDTGEICKKGVIELTQMKKDHVTAAPVDAHTMPDLSIGIPGVKPDKGSRKKDRKGRKKKGRKNRKNRKGKKNRKGRKNKRKDKNSVTENSASRNRNVASTS